MTIETFKQSLDTFNDHEIIYQTYSSLSENEQSDFLIELRSSYRSDKSLWLPSFFEKDHLFPLSEDMIFADYTDRNIVLQKHNRYTPAIFHDHTFFEIIYVYKGQALHMINDESSRMIEGDLIIIAPNTSHALEVNDNSIILDVLVKKSSFGKHFFEFLKDDNLLASFFRNDLYSKTTSPYIMFKIKKDLKLEQVLFEMFMEFNIVDGYSNSIINNQLMIFFSLLLRDYQRQVIRPNIRTKQSEQFSLILTYLHSNYNNITLTSAANFFHFTSPYFSTYIKKNTGVNFSQLIQSIRLDHSRELLQNSQLSIEAICEEVGYANPPHFIRIFKSKYGMPPATYRKYKINKVQFSVDSNESSSIE